MITLQNVSKQFIQNGRLISALNDVTLDVHKGEICGVIGRSGAGKSTLIRCVNLLERCTSGKIIIDGSDITDFSEKKLAPIRYKMSMIFQHFNLLASRTVFGNVALPLELSHTSKKIIKEKVTRLLDLVGLSDKAKMYPSHLSGGQKQRVAIARALANDPKILLCDEATSALDPETTRSILTLLKEINVKLGLTILLITHEMDVVKQICDKVAIIHEGQLVEQASVGEIFSNPQTEMAKQFIQSTLHIDIPEDYLARLENSTENKGHPLLKIQFYGATVDSPLLSLITKQFYVECNIISAQMDYIAGVKFGMMLTEIMGSESNTHNAIQFLQQNKVKIEVIGYV